MTPVLRRENDYAKKSSANKLYVRLLRHNTLKINVIVVSAIGASNCPLSGIDGTDQSFKALETIQNPLNAMQSYYTGTCGVKIRGLHYDRPLSAGW